MANFIVRIGRNFQVASMEYSETYRRYQMTPVENSPLISPDEISQFAQIRASTSKERKDLAEAVLKEAMGKEADYVFWDDSLIILGEESILGSGIFLQTDVYIRRESTQNNEDTPFREKQYAK